MVSVQSSVSVYHGHTTTLPCWLNPPRNAEGLEVRWYYRDRFDTPIIFYGAQTLDASLDASYKDRVTFGLRDAASGGLKTGDVSLTLANVTIRDVGDYTCYVSSDQGYDKGIIRLSVLGECHASGKTHKHLKDDFIKKKKRLSPKTFLIFLPQPPSQETGTSPFLSVKWIDGKKVNVSCESTGWYPQPQLRWSDQEQDLHPESIINNTSSSGLISVRSWILVSSFSEISCSVGLTGGEKKVARVHLGNPPRGKENYLHVCNG